MSDKVNEYIRQRRIAYEAQIGERSRADFFPAKAEHTRLWKELSADEKKAAGPLYLAMHAEYRPRK